MRRPAPCGLLPVSRDYAWAGFAAAFATAWARREMRRDAAFLWTTPFELAFPRVRSAVARAALAAAASPFSRASRTRFTALFTPVRTATLRVRRFWACRLRFSADRVFAKLTSLRGKWRALITARRERRQGVMRPKPPPNPR